MYIYTSLVISYMISQFIFGNTLNWVIGVLAIISIIYSIFHASGLYLKSGIIFLIIGFILFLYNKLPWYAALLHFKPTLSLLSLFLVLSFIKTLLRIGHYDKKLSLLLQDNLSSLDSLYRRSFIVSFILGIFLNIAVFPLLINSLNYKLSHFASNIRNNFYARNLLRAFFLSISWSPMEVMVSTALDITNVKYYSILPVIIIIIVIAIGTDWILSSFKFKKIGLPIEDSNLIDYKSVLKNVVQLIIKMEPASYLSNRT